MKYLKLFENKEKGKYWKVKCDFGNKIPELKFSLKKLKMSKKERDEIEDGIYEIGHSEPYIYILYDFEGYYTWTWIETDSYAEVYGLDFYKKLKNMKYMGEVDISDDIEKWHMKQDVKKYNI
jgi:hypothetical protein